MILHGSRLDNRCWWCIASLLCECADRWCRHWLVHFVEAAVVILHERVPARAVRVVLHAECLRLDLSVRYIVGVLLLEYVCFWLAIDARSTCEHFAVFMVLLFLFL